MGLLNMAIFVINTLLAATFEQSPGFAAGFIVGTFFATIQHLLPLLAS